MNLLNRKTKISTLHPEKIIQFGEGNFLRAFADWIVYRMNQSLNFNAGVVVVQPIDRGMSDVLNEQNGLYTLILKGLQNSRPVRTLECIDVINRCLDPYRDYQGYLETAENPQLRYLISNTTEAGIVFKDTDRFDHSPASTYPGKLTRWLFHRFEYFRGDPGKGMILFPCELIDRNGDHLRDAVLRYAVLWNLGESFTEWVEEVNIFCNTLVDRIVPGFPKNEIQPITEELGYEDKLVVEGEIFHLWVIEGPALVRREFPADKAGLNVLFTDSMKPYRDRKVTLLNGPHTVLSPVSWLYGLDTVREACEDAKIGAYVRKVMYEELLPTLDLPEHELKQFADEVLDRFKNPYVRHQVTDIMLNAFPKYKTRDLPSVLKYLNIKDTLPKGLVFGLAAILFYYSGTPRVSDKKFPVIRDDEKIVSMMSDLWKEGDVSCLVHTVLSSETLWERDLTEVPGMEALLSEYLNEMIHSGVPSALDRILSE